MGFQGLERCCWQAAAFRMDLRLTDSVNVSLLLQPIASPAQPTETPFRPGREYRSAGISRLAGPCLARSASWELFKAQRACLLFSVGHLKKKKNP